MYVRAAPADASEIGGDFVVLIAELHELSANNRDPYRAWDGKYAPWSANNPLNSRCKTIGLYSRTKRTPLKWHPSASHQFSHWEYGTCPRSVELESGRAQNSNTISLETWEILCYIWCNQPVSSETLLSQGSVDHTTPRPICGLFCQHIPVLIFPLSQILSLLPQILAHDTKSIDESIWINKSNSILMK